MTAGPCRVLNVIDEHTRVSLGSHAARSFSSASVLKQLERLFVRHGRPTLIRADNGREFIADTVQDWLGEQGVRAVFVAKASPAAELLYRAVQRLDGAGGLRQ